MNEGLFRKNVIDRVSSPEQLNDYIRVANPSVWMVLASVISLLIGVCAWGVLGRLDTTVSALAVTEGGNTVVYIREGDIASVQEEMTVRINDRESVLVGIAAAPQKVDDSLGEYALHIGGLTQGDWVWPADVSGVFEEGVHSAEIVIESVAPMSFVVN